MLTRPLTQPLTGPLVRGVGEGGNGAVLSAFSATKFAIQQNTADVNILAIGDSTSDATNEWVYLFGQWLATQYPTHSVSYRLWDDVGKAYGTASAISTGTGSNTIRIWNASVSGTRPLHHMGSNLAAAVTATNASLILWNHGKNQRTDAAISVTMVRGEWLAALEQVRAALPNAYHATLRQSPNRDDDLMAPVVTTLDGVAATYGDMREPDVYSRFIAAGKPAAWYSDNLHPSVDGSAEFSAAVQAQWLAAAPGSAYPRAARLLATTGTNLLANSDFTNYAGGTPTGWVNVNTPTCTVETTIKERSQSLKIVGTVAGCGLYYEVPNVSAYLGQTLTLAVRQYIPPGGASTVGRISLRTHNSPSDNVVVTTGQGDVATGGWRWYILSGFLVAANSTWLRAFIYCDSSANTTSVAYYDRAILVVGDIPRDML